MSMGGNVAKRMLVPVWRSQNERQAYRRARSSHLAPAPQDVSLEVGPSLKKAGRSAEGWAGGVARLEVRPVWRREFDLDI